VKRVLPVVLAIAAYFVGVLYWLSHDRRMSRHAFDDYSTSNTNSDGLSLAPAYLRRSGRDVRTLIEPITETSVAQKAVVFRIGGLRMFTSSRDEAEDEDDDQALAKKTKRPRHHYVTPLLTDNEEEFVRSGGRLVIALDRGETSLEVGDAPERVARKVFPLWEGLETLEWPKSRAVGGEALRNAHAVYTIGEQTAIARLALGAGDVLVFGVPEALDNEHLAKQLPLLVALAGERRIVYFDELLHGMSADTGTLELLKDWRLGPFLLLLLLTAIVVAWRRGTRIGEPDDEYRDTRSEAIDLVGSLGALYDRTMTRGESLAAYYRELTRAVASSTGLRGDALRRRVEDLTGGLTPAWKHQNIGDEELAQQIKTINDAFRRVELSRNKHADDSGHRQSLQRAAQSAR